MPAARITKINRRAYETRAVAESLILLYGQICSPAVTSRPSARMRKAREHGSEGGMILPPCIKGDPIKYAIKCNEAVKTMRHASTKAATARLGRSTDGESVSKNDIAETTKQIVTIGDICPIGIPSRVPVMERPRCSICGYVPAEEKKNSRSEVTVTTEPMNMLIKYVPRYRGKRLRKKIAAPNSTRRNAVLGAIGIRLEPKLVKRGNRKIQPSRARNPIAAVRIPAVKMKTFPA